MNDKIAENNKQVADNKDSFIIFKVDLFLLNINRLAVSRRSATNFYIYSNGEQKRYF